MSVFVLHVCERVSMCAAPYFLYWQADQVTLEFCSLTRKLEEVVQGWPWSRRREDASSVSGRMPALGQVGAERTTGAPSASLLGPWHVSATPYRGLVGFPFLPGE